MKKFSALALILALMVSPCSAEQALQTKTFSADEKAQVFSLNQIALLETFGGVPKLKVFDPFSYQIKVTEFAKNKMAPLTHVKDTTINYSSKKIFETYYPGSSKATVGRLLRGNAERPALNPIVDVYQRRIPTCWKLADYGELSALVSNVKSIFETEGVIASNKPLLVVQIDGTSSNLNIATQDAEFLNTYYDVTSFADAQLRTHFHESQDLMIRRIGDVMGNQSKDYPNDGYFGAFARWFNGKFKRGDVRRMIPEASDTIWKGASIAAVAAFLFTPMQHGMEWCKLQAKPVTDPIAGLIPDAVTKAFTPIK